MGLIQRRLVKLQEKVEALKKCPQPPIKTQVCAFHRLADYYICFLPDIFLLACPSQTWHGKDSWKIWHGHRRLKKCSLWGIYLRTCCAGCTRPLAPSSSESQSFSQEHLVTFISQKIKPPVESEYSAIGKKGLAINWVILERLQIIQTQFLLEVHLLLSVAQIMTQTQEWGHGLLCFKTFDFSLDIGCRR